MLSFLVKVNYVSSYQLQSQPIYSAESPVRGEFITGKSFSDLRIQVNMFYPADARACTLAHERIHAQQFQDVLEIVTLMFLIPVIFAGYTVMTTLHAYGLTSVADLAYWITIAGVAEAVVFGLLTNTFYSLASKIFSAYYLWSKSFYETRGFAGYECCGMEQEAFLMAPRDCSAATYLVTTLTRVPFYWLLSDTILMLEILLAPSCAALYLPKSRRAIS